MTLLDWLKLAAALPPAVVAWKLPALWNWLKMRFATAAAAAVMEQLAPVLAQMQEHIGQVRYQVFPNGGGSMSDQLNRVLATSQSTERNVLLLRDTMRAHQDADTSQVRFEADAEGHWTWTSLTLQRWCAKSVEQALGFGWINCVAHEDRERVREEWHAAFTEQREFNLRFALLDATSLPFAVEALAKPLRNGGAATSWVGVITRTG